MYQDFSRFPLRFLIIEHQNEVISKHQDLPKHTLSDTTKLQQTQRLPTRPHLTLTLPFKHQKPQHTPSNHTHHQIPTCTPSNTKIFHQTPQNINITLPTPDSRCHQTPRIFIKHQHTQSSPTAVVHQAMPRNTIIIIRKQTYNTGKKTNTTSYHQTPMTTNTGISNI